MNKLKCVTMRLADELNNYQLIEEGSEHQPSLHKYQLKEEEFEHAGHNKDGESLGGRDEVEEDIIWDYYHFPSIGDGGEGNGRTKMEKQFEEKVEDESEFDLGDEAEVWLLQDANHMHERYIWCI